MDTTAFVLEGNVELSISNSKLTSPSGMIATGQNSKVKIRDSVLKAGLVAIEGSGNLNVEAHRSTLEGSTIVRYREKGNVTFSGASVVRAGQSVVEGKYGEWKVDASTVDSEGILFAERESGIVRLSGSKLTSKKGALSFVGGGHLWMSNATLQSEGCAKFGDGASVNLDAGSILRCKGIGIDARSNLILTATKATLETSGYAVSAEVNAQINIDAESTVTARPPFSLGHNAKLRIPAALAAAQKAKR
jgi:hypothetical protein